MTDAIPVIPRTLAGDELLSWREVARIRKCSRAKAYQIMARLPRVRDGASTLVWRSDLDLYIQALPVELPQQSRL
jgi:hypothetical protein